MSANEKIAAYGEDAIAVACGRSVSIVYRWRKALADGEGISRQAMIKLIQATRGSEHAIAWADFEPTELLEAAAQKPLPADDPREQRLGHD